MGIRHHEDKIVFGEKMSSRKTSLNTSDVELYFQI